MLIKNPMMMMMMNVLEVLGCLKSFTDGKLMVLRCLMFEYIMVHRSKLKMTGTVNFCYLKHWHLKVLSYIKKYSLDKFSSLYSISMPFISNY